MRCRSGATRRQELELAVRVRSQPSTHGARHQLIGGSSGVTNARLIGSAGDLRRRTGLIVRRKVRTTNSVGLVDSIQGTVCKVGYVRLSVHDATWHEL